MFRSSIEDASKAWFFFEPLTLLYPYKILQKQVVEAYAPYVNIVDRYSKTAKRAIGAVTDKYCKEHPKVTEQNVALLKNAMELWRTAARTSDAVAPILYHYSWHCFNSFFIYTLFKWEPQHSKGHGVQPVLSDNLENVKIRILKTGLFRRLIDTWTLLGVPLAFSPVLPMFQNGKLNFVRNDVYLLKRSNEVSLKQLLAFNPEDFENTLYSRDLKDELLHCTFLINNISLPNMTLKSYLMLFVTSSLARYRPVLWHSILTGKTEAYSDFALHSTNALLDYTVGSHIPGPGLLPQIVHLFGDIRDGRFKFLNREGKHLKTL